MSIMIRVRATFPRDLAMAYCNCRLLSSHWGMQQHNNSVTSTCIWIELQWMTLLSGCTSQHWTRAQSCHCVPSREWEDTCSIIGLVPIVRIANQECNKHIIELCPIKLMITMFQYCTAGFFHGGKLWICGDLQSENQPGLVPDNATCRVLADDALFTFSSNAQICFWSSIDGCTYFNNHGCQNFRYYRSIQHSRGDESYASGRCIWLLHSQTESADSKMRCQTWRNSLIFLYSWCAYRSNSQTTESHSDEC